MKTKLYLLHICLLGSVLLSAITSEGQRLTKIAAGSDDSLFLKSDNSLWAMGWNVYGQLGDGSNNSTNRPEQILATGVTEVAAGGEHTLFLKNDSSLWAMGDNEYGQLGDSTYNNTNLPEMIVASNVTAITAGGSGLSRHSLFLKSDGSLWAMGDNEYGQLGDGTYNNTNLPEMIVASNVTAVATGFSHSLFLKSDGSLWAMGNNFYGELGDGTYNSTNLPEMIVATNVSAIAAGYFYSLFLKSDGSLWAMGWNEYGELGNGTNNIGYPYGTNLPIKVVGSNVIAIAAGEAHSLFLKNDGSLWAVGYNGDGQLGDGTYNEADSPEQIVTNAVMAITAGNNHSLFLKCDGSLWAMGDDGHGQLGDGNSGVNFRTNRPEEIVAISPPPLGIGTYGNQPVVFFPTATGTNFVLQMTTNLASPNWVPVTSGVPMIGLQITNATGTAFFRLH